MKGILAENLGEQISPCAVPRAAGALEHVIGGGLSDGRGGVSRPGRN